MRLGIALTTPTNGTAKDRVDGVDLVRCCLRNGHVVELRADRVIELVPEVTPVLIGIGRTQDPLSLCHGEKLDLFLGRFANKTDVVLSKHVSQNPSRVDNEHRGTHVDNIELDTRLGANTVLVAPALGKMWHVEHAAEFDLALAYHGSDAVLHIDREAGAEQRAAHEAVPELLSESPRVVVLGDGPVEKMEKLDHGLVDEVTRADRDILRHLPGEENQDADHALVRPLWAVLGEGVLHVTMVSNREVGKTRPLDPRDWYVPESRRASEAWSAPLPRQTA